jgi:Domain of unknown function (DUF3387)
MARGQPRNTPSQGGQASRNGATVGYEAQLWQMADALRGSIAQLRVLVKRILRKYGYPPDKQEKATITVLEQAEILSAGWAT